MVELHLAHSVRRPVSPLPLVLDSQLLVVGLITIVVVVENGDFAAAMTQAVLEPAAVVIQVAFGLLALELDIDDVHEVRWGVRPLNATLHDTVLEIPSTVQVILPESAVVTGGEVDLALAVRTPPLVDVTVVVVPGLKDHGVDGAANAIVGPAPIVDHDVVLIPQLALAELVVFLKIPSEPAHLALIAHESAFTLAVALPLLDAALVRREAVLLLELRRNFPKFALPVLLAVLEVPVVFPPVLILQHASAVAQALAPPPLVGRVDLLLTPVRPASHAPKDRTLPIPVWHPCAQVTVIPGIIGKLHFPLDEMGHDTRRGQRCLPLRLAGQLTVEVEGWDANVLARQLQLPVRAVGELEIVVLAEKPLKHGGLGLAALVLGHPRFVLGGVLGGCLVLGGLGQVRQVVQPHLRGRRALKKQGDWARLSLLDQGKEPHFPVLEVRLERSWSLDLLVLCTHVCGVISGGDEDIQRLDLVVGQLPLLGPARGAQRVLHSLDAGDTPCLLRCFAQLVRGLGHDVIHVEIFFPHQARAGRRSEPRCLGTGIPPWH
mmetsp:Transcript_68771/g.157775  ORF Transcript_68771/g.157775 Transcript_68771/m.157775 type:complete len:547 (-) Transcript_68771:1494-3134(-)